MQVTTTAHRKGRNKAPAMYAPRPTAPQAATAAQVSPQLRRLTQRVLEELKHPGAIPSVVVMRALAEAQALK